MNVYRVDELMDEATEKLIFSPLFSSLAFMWQDKCPNHLSQIHFLGKNRNKINIYGVCQFIHHLISLAPVVHSNLSNITHNGT